MNFSQTAHISSDEVECEQDVPEPPAKRVKTYKETVECLEDLLMFLEHKIHTKAATEADILVNKGTKFQLCVLYNQASPNTSNLVNANHPSAYTLIYSHNTWYNHAKCNIVFKN